MNQTCSPWRPPLFTLCLVAMAACSQEKATPAPPARVGVVNVTPTSVPLTRSLVGRLSPHLSANVTARVSGVLLKREYVEGSRVKQGQVLFQLDPTYYQTALNNSLAVLAQDRATYDYDRVTAARNRQLLPVGSVSQQTVDEANATEASAAAKVKADEAAAQSARINLGYTQVRSPIDGIARQQQVTPGALVGSSTSDTGSGGTLLTTVDQIDSVYANFTVSAADLVGFARAQAQGAVTLTPPAQTTVQIALADGSPYESAGTLDFFDSAANATTGAVNLRALVPNTQHSLLSGTYVTLNVRFGSRNNVFLVPQQGLQRDTAGAFALVVDSTGKVLRKNVVATESAGQDWIVTSGLAAGDSVIVSGLQNAHEGAPVTTTPWRTTGSPETTSPINASAVSGSHSPSVH